MHFQKKKNCTRDNQITMMSCTPQNSVSSSFKLHWSSHWLTVITKMHSVSTLYSGHSTTYAGIWDYCSKSTVSIITLNLGSWSVLHVAQGIHYLHVLRMITHSHSHTPTHAGTTHDNGCCAPRGPHYLHVPCYLSTLPRVLQRRSMQLVTKHAWDCAKIVIESCLPNRPNCRCGLLLVCKATSNK